MQRRSTHRDVQKPCSKGPVNSLTGKMRPIPSPKGLPVLGTLLSIIAAGGASKLHLYVDRRHKELGAIYREKIGPVSGVFIADGNYARKIFAAEGKHPRHIIPESWLLYNKLYNCQRGLLFMDGEEWLRHRKIMNNIMLKVKQDAFYRACEVAANDLIENWRGGGQILQLETRLYEWSLKVIVAVLLGCDNYLLSNEELLPRIERLAKTIHEIFIESATLSLMPVQLAVKLNLPVWKRFVKAATSAMEEGKNLLEILLEIEKRSPDEKSVLFGMVSNGIEYECVKRIATDLILAAGDTTAFTTLWLLHLLSIDSRAQTKIYEEVKNWAEDGVRECSLLKGALKEALRLCPVAPFLTRFMPRDLIVDGYQIKAEELVLISLYSSGRSERHFPEPESFRPERWLRKNGGDYEGVLSPTASLPFAMGSRSCIGKKLAETQILVAVSMIINNFVVKSESGKRIDVKLHLISVPAQPVNIILEPRKAVHEKDK